MGWSGERRRENVHKNSHFSPFSLSLDKTPKKHTVSCTLDPVTVSLALVHLFSLPLSQRRKKKNRSHSRKGSFLLLHTQGAPRDPRFRRFLAESDALIQSLGGRLSPSQSLPSALDNENGNGNDQNAAVDFGNLDQSLIKGRGGSRFATPYLKRVFEADARAQELKRAGRW